MKIYLASPLGFSETTKDFMEKLENKLKNFGFEVLNPWSFFPEGKIENVMNIKTQSDKKKALHALNFEIAQTNEQALKECNIIFAVLDGSDVDSGTANEIGYGYAIGKKIIGYRGDFRLSGENEGSIINLQVQYWIEKSGGCIIRKASEIESVLCTRMS
jgi:nucleoside 2-deoxyribosyltransferase